MAKKDDTTPAKKRKPAAHLFLMGDDRRWYVDIKHKKRTEDPARVRELKRQKSREAGWKSLGLPSPTRPLTETCEICGNPPNKRALSLDHCHKTGRHRGWLCFKCNFGIGIFGDSVENLEKAIKYLQRD